MADWVIKTNSKKDVKLRLFCFPYAGSSALVTYKFLADNLNPDIEVCYVEFPGRGSRIAEPLINEMDSVVKQIAESITKHLDIPFIFLGHSMGALVSYELTHYLNAQLISQPKKLYLSAHKVPSASRDCKLMHKLSKEEFLSEIINMNGVSKEILEHEELLELVLPIIKNDYKLCETYCFSDKGKLDIPISVFGGNKDVEVTEDHLKGWENFTNSAFKLELFDGDHFFITKNRGQFFERFSAYLNEDLKKLKFNNDKF